MGSVSPHLAAVAFFDQLERPLSSVEAARFALGAAPAGDALAVRGAVRTDGKWHLPGREEIVATRERRYLLSQRKLRLARRVARWMAFVPTVRMVAAYNSVSFANANEDSDIDLFVVAAPGTVWVTRFILVSALALLRMRPDDVTHRDRVCMSYFVDESAMDLSRARSGPDDIAYLYYLAAFLPIYDAGGVGERFFAANRWIADELPGWRPEEGSMRFRVAPVRGLGWAIPLLRLGERMARRMQERWFPERLRALIGVDSRVVVDDRMLKFHVHDRRDELRERFRETLTRATSTIE